MKTKYIVTIEHTDPLDKGIVESYPQITWRPNHLINGTDRSDGFQTTMVAANLSDIFNAVVEHEQNNIENAWVTMNKSIISTVDLPDSHKIAEE